jgi:type IV pilus assembly protein PilZ
MADEPILNYTINDPVELNLSYMPFIAGGGLFVPTFQNYVLGTDILVDLLLPGKKENMRIEGKIVWITPQNALHHVLPGIGIQFTGVNAPSVKSQMESYLDKSIEIGGYTYGMTEEDKRTK